MMKKKRKSNKSSRKSNHATHIFRLYIAGDTPNSLLARSNLEKILSTLPANKCNIEVVDALANPGQALADDVMVTPTLIRLLPTPEFRIIGTLNDHDKVLSILGL